VNPSEVSEAPDLEAPQPELSVLAEASPDPVLLGPSELNPSPWNPSWLRLAYALEFFLAVIAIISMWSEVGGEGHLDLMPWYIKLGCILGLAWCSMRFTASLVEQQRVWTGRAIGWLLGILLFCLFMGGITYYYHLHEEPDDGDEDNTAAAANINCLGSFFYHGNKRSCSTFPIRFVVRSGISGRDRISVGSDGRDPCVRL